MSKKKTGQFKTTGGSIINVPVTSSGQTVDGNKLYEAIAEAINNKSLQQWKQFTVRQRKKKQVNMSHMVAITVKWILPTRWYMYTRMESLLYQVSVLQDVFQRSWNTYRSVFYLLKR